MLPRAVRRADFESERVFADDSVFDDDAEIVVRIFQYFDPFERIALDYQKIGQRTFFDNAEIAGIRVACAGKRQQTGVVADNHSENFEIGEPLLQLDDPVILIFSYWRDRTTGRFPKPILRRVFWRGGMSDPFR